MGHRLRVGREEEDVGHTRLRLTAAVVSAGSGSGENRSGRRGGGGGWTQAWDAGVPDGVTGEMDICDSSS